MKNYTVIYTIDNGTRNSVCATHTKVCYGYLQYRRLIKSLRSNPGVNELRVIK